MNKKIKIIFLVCFILIFSGVNAQNTDGGFCSASVPLDVLEEDPSLPISYTDDCNCWDWTPITTEWRQNFCVNGKMLEERTVEDLITPECSTRYTYYEERQVINTLCRLCDNPSGYSDWEIVSYYEHGLLKKRTAFDACWFDSITDEKKYSDKTQFAFFRVEYDDTAQIFYNLLTVIVMICVFILLAYIIKKSKKKKKRDIPLVGIGLISIGGIIIVLLMTAIIPFTLISPGMELPGSQYIEGYSYLFYNVKNTIVTPNQDFAILLNPVEMYRGVPLPEQSYPTTCNVRFSVQAQEIASYRTSPSYCNQNESSCSINEFTVGPANFFIPSSNFSEGLTGKQVVHMETNCRYASGGDTPFIWVRDVEAWVDSSECQLSEGHFWVIEHFVGGRTITKDDLRFRPTAFCADRPIFVYEMGSVVEQKIEEMSFLMQSYITIPAGQLWEISYIVNENDAPDLMIDCSIYGEDVVYDAVNDVCIKTPVVVTVCSGTLTPEGECIMQLTTRCVDENGVPVEGAFYNVEEDICIKVIPTEIQLLPGDCPENSEVIVDEGGIRKCLFQPGYDCDGRLDYSTDPPTCFGFVDYELVVIQRPFVGYGGLIIAGSFILVGIYLVLKR